MLTSVNFSLKKTTFRENIWPCRVLGGVERRAALINAARVKKKRGGRVDRRGQASCTPLEWGMEVVVCLPSAPSFLISLLRF